MRLLTIVLIFLAADALAFNPSVWLQRRAEFMKHASSIRQDYSNAVLRVSEPAEKVRVPFELHPDGSVKTLIVADRAQFFLEENLIWAEGVVIRQCDEAGKETGRVEAEKMVFNRVTKRGWAEGPAKVLQGKTAFSGVDVFFALEDEYVLSFRSSYVDSKDLKVGGSR